MFASCIGSGGTNAKSSPFIIRSSMIEMSSAKETEILWMSRQQDELPDFPMLDDAELEQPQNLNPSVVPTTPATRPRDFPPVVMVVSGPASERSVDILTACTDSSREPDECAAGRRSPVQIRRARNSHGARAEGRGYQIFGDSRQL